jgi:HNH endonuclease
MPLVDRRFYFDYKDGDRLYPQLFPSTADISQWVFHISPARNALGHRKEAVNLQELKYHVLELGWRMRARSDQGRNGSYSRHAGGVKSHGEDMSLSPPDGSSVSATARSTNKHTAAEAVGSKGGVRDGEKDARGVKRRSGQGRYKLDVVKLWQSCSVTGCINPNLLVASHIVAHKNSELHEQLDPHNGLLLTPNLDRLFDRGLISFDENGTILIARRVDAETRQHFGIHAGMKLRHIPRPTAPYLARHREAFYAREEFRA